MLPTSYFINEDDEVRSIENPNNYFKYYLSRNPRWNDRQRFAMNRECISTWSILGLLEAD